MMASKQICTFYVDDLYLGVDVSRVREVTRGRELTPVPRAPAAVAGLMNLRSQIVFAIALRRCLGLPDRAAGAEAMHVITAGDDGPMALIVDRLGDVRSLADEDFEAAPSHLDARSRRLIRGAYKLNEGLLLSLDVDALAAPEAWEPPTPASPRTSHASESGR